MILNLYTGVNTPKNGTDQTTVPFYPEWLSLYTIQTDIEQIIYDPFIYRIKHTLSISAASDQP
jgi:hypothetical protein